MASKEWNLTGFELDYSGFNALRNSPEMMSILEDLAADLASSSDLNLETAVNNRQTRAVATIRCADTKSYYRNNKTNELVKLIKGGGL